VKVEVVGRDTIRTVARLSARRRAISLALAAALVVAATGTATARERAPRNVILMIGDGMGPAQITLGRRSLPAGATALALDSFPVTGLVRTDALDGTITDSAAAATAMAAGIKTLNGRIGMSAEGKSVLTILEAAKRRGRATGLITTTAIAHATPAAFAAHASSRDDRQAIAAQMLGEGIEVLIGGGRQDFLPQVRADKRDLLAEARSAGYAVATDEGSWRAADRLPLLALLAEDGLTTRPPEPTLADLVERALALLADDPDGFFLMVEGGQIDWRCHDNDATGAAEEMLEFDAAIGRVRAFAERRGQTLILVTGDHETGGLTLVSGDPGGAPPFRPSWGTDGHTAVDVPLFAAGPGSQRFAGFIDNTEIAKRIADLWGLPAPGR
jgi:alkaline phosphatase